jgi:hypothetical protein
MLSIAHEAPRIFYCLSSTPELIGIVTREDCQHQKALPARCCIFIPRAQSLGRLWGQRLCRCIYRILQWYSLYNEQARYIFTRLRKWLLCLFVPGLVVALPLIFQLSILSHVTRLPHSPNLGHLVISSLCTYCSLFSSFMPHPLQESK